MKPSLQEQIRDAMMITDHNSNTDEKYCALSNSQIQALVDLFNSRLGEMEEEIEGLKGTDDTQMSHDHIYDEALTSALQVIKSKRI